MDVKDLLRDLLPRMHRIRYYPDKRHVLDIGEIHGRLKAAQHEFSIEVDEERDDYLWLDLIDRKLDHEYESPKVATIKKLADAIEAYLADPDHAPGPDQVREALSPRYDPGSGIDCTTTAAA